MSIICVENDSAQLKKFRLMLCGIIILPKYPFWSEGSLQISFFLLRNFTKNSNTVSLDGCSLRVEIVFVKLEQNRSGKC